MSRALAKRAPSYGQPRELPLDAPIDRSLKALNAAVAAWERIEPILNGFIPVVQDVVADGLDSGEFFSRKTGKAVTKGEWVREVAADLVQLLEKLSRTSVNMTKVVDEAARLRLLLSGGEDERPDIGGLGDQELIDIIVELVLARGLWRVVQSRAKQRGIVIEAEVLSEEKS